jgi:hypothetical protein
MRQLNKQMSVAVTVERLQLLQRLKNLDGTSGSRRIAEELERSGAWERWIKLQKGLQELVADSR